MYFSVFFVASVDTLFHFSFLWTPAPGCGHGSPYEIIRRIRAEDAKIRERAVRKAKRG